MRFAAVVLCVFGAMVGFRATTGLAQDTPPNVLALLGKTKTFTGTYSLYVWNRITVPGKAPVEEWSAEFHSGKLHRVETPRDRVVADCGTRTGVAIHLETGAVVEGPHVAGAACGINTNGSLTALDWVGSVATAFGQAERIRLIDSEFVRQYDISNKGVLLHTTYTEKRPDGRLVLDAEATKIDSGIPSQDMFDRNSLQRSFVPDEYKRLSSH